MTTEFRHLLVIDHRPEPNQGCLLHLQNAGYSLEHTADPSEALARVASGKFVAAIANAQTPGLQVLGLPFFLADQGGWVVFALPAGLRRPRDLMKPLASLWLPQPVSGMGLCHGLDYVLSTIGKGATDTRPLEEAALLAHEFRSPLASTQTTAQTLRQGYYGPLTPPQLNAVERIERNCSYLEDTLNCISDWFAFESRPPAVPAAPIDLVAAVIDPVLDHYRDNRKAMPLTLDCRETVLLQADPRWLRIVVSNLLDNAIKYGETGSPVVIAVLRQDEAAAFSVRNRGIGIPAADHGRLFQRFARLKQAGSEGIKGSGLGLYLCHRIVTMLRGTIEVQSESDGFTEFTVRLPATLENAC